MSIEILMPTFFPLSSPIYGGGPRDSGGWGRARRALIGCFGLLNISAPLKWCAPSAPAGHLPHAWGREKLEFCHAD